ncbi:MAG: hypothetical protein AAFV26_09220, partial [Pseudomonadota bacterium]
MRFGPLVFAFAGFASICGLCSLTARADDDPGFPSWRINQICATDSAVGQCQLFERRARDALFGAWTFILPDHRKACLAEVTPPVEPSFRVLSGCIEVKAA